MSKDSFILYTNDRKHIEKLSMQQRGELLTAIMAYVCGDDVDELDPMTDMLFGTIVDKLDYNAQKYDEKIEARSRAGKASAEARKNKKVKEQESTKPTSVDFVEQRATSSTDIVIDIDNDIGIDIGIGGIEEFSPPTIMNILEFIAKNNIKSDSNQAAAFIDYYSKKDWMIDGKKMESWENAFLGWNERGYDKRDRKKTRSRSRPNTFNNFKNREYDFEKLEKAVIGCLDA